MPTGEKKPTEPESGKRTGPRKRVRVLRVVLLCLTITAVCVSAALWSSRDLLRYAAEEKFRAFLESTGNLDFHVASKEFRLFPPRIELANVTVGDSGEAWVLNVDRAALELSPSVFFFRRSGGARLRLERPRFISHGRGLVPAPAGEGAAVPENQGAGADGSFDPASIFDRNIPLSSVEIRDGEIVVAKSGEGVEIGGLSLSAALSGGRLIGRMKFDRGFVVTRGKVWELGRVSLDTVVDRELATVRNLHVKAPLLEGDFSGSVAWDGTGEVNVAATVPLGTLLERLGRGRPLEGRLAVKGKVTGRLDDPAFSGQAELLDPAAGGHRWPDVKGVVSWKQKRLQWREMTADIAGGALSTSGFISLARKVPRYKVTVESRELYPAALSPLAETAAESVRNVSGTLHWEGEGVTAETLSGRGSVNGIFGVEALGWAPVDIEVETALTGTALDIRRIILRSGDSLFRSRGSWDGGGLRLYVEAAVGSLASVLAPLETEGFDGRLFAEGELTYGREEGLFFEGPIRWENGEAFGLRPFGATASVSFDGREVSLDNGRVGWRGAEIEVSGKLFLEEKRIDLLTAWEDLALIAVAPIFGIEEKIDGFVDIDGRLLGEWDNPILSGRFVAESLRYGGISVDEAMGALSFAGGVLDLQEVTLRSGESELSLSGRVDGEKVSGSIESLRFDLRAFVPASVADVVGTFSADFGGTVRSPRAVGSYTFFSLKYETWRFKEAGGDFEYRNGSFRLEGHLTDPVNRYRLTVEPRNDWPFSASVNLGRFSPELAQEGFLGLPDQLRGVLQQISFLAVGDFAASGNLKDLMSIRASLDLETIWVYTENQTLQNLDNLEVAWEGGVVRVEDFSVAGEDYRITLSGSGSIDEGWDLFLGGHVNLSIFQDFWEEIEYIDAPGNIELRLVGPWETPEVSGKFDIAGGELKAAGLDSPVSGISGDGELKDRVFHLNDFSGSMGENHFHAGGKLDLDSREVDAFVEGHLDLSVFRNRVPGTREMKGPVNTRLTLQGNVARPRILGEAVLESAEVFHQAMPQRITGLSGRVVVDEESLVVEELAGKMGTGDIALKGLVDWSEEPVRVDVGLSASRVVFVLEGIAKALLSADLKLGGNFDDLLISGDIEFHKARYFREFKEKIKKPAALSKAKKKEDGEAARPGPDLSRTALDVNITAPDRFWIVNSTANLENSVAIHLGGTVEEPRLDGEIRLLRGEVTYFARRFTLFSGRIYNIPPGIDPYVEAQAEVMEGGTRIFLLLEGPLKKPTLQLTSLPPMNQEDLMALLTVGYTRSDLEEQSGESIAIGAAIVFGAPVIEQISEGAREISGIEFFQVQPAMSEDTSTAKVTLGTQLSDRLFMSASQTIGLTEEQQVRLEYQLFDYVSVLGQQLRQGMYTLDLVFQWDFD